MSDTLNIALLGQKFMARAHSHAYANVGRFFNLPRTPVMHTIAARDLIALAPFASRWGWKNYSTNWKDVVKSGDVDFIDVSTPTQMHCEQVLAAIAAGKHVAVEKPLAVSLKEARQMRNAAVRSRRSKSFVWFNYRRVPAIAMAHRLVKEGRLGRIYHVRANFLQSWADPDQPLSWRFQKKYAGFGAHGDLNAQIVDLVRFIVGDSVVEVSGAASETFITERELQTTPGSRSTSRRKARGKVDVEDALVFIARLANGALASFESSRVATGNHNQLRMEINGSNGALRFALDDFNWLWYYDTGLETGTNGWKRVDVTQAGDHPYAGAWWPQGHAIGFEHTYINTLADIIAVLGGGSPIVPLADFEDAYETQRILEAAALSAKHRTAVKMNEIK